MRNWANWSLRNSETPRLGSLNGYEHQYSLRTLLVLSCPLDLYRACCTTVCVNTDQTTTIFFFGPEIVKKTHKETPIRSPLFLYPVLSLGQSLGLSRKVSEHVVTYTQDWSVTQQLPNMSSISFWVHQSKMNTFFFFKSTLEYICNNLSTLEAPCLRTGCPHPNPLFSGPAVVQTTPRRPGPRIRTKLTTTIYIHIYELRDFFVGAVVGPTRTHNLTTFAAMIGVGLVWDWFFPDTVLTGELYSSP